MTPTQKQIVKDRARLDAEMVINLLELFLRKSGHLGYKHVMPLTDCPQPTIIIDEDTTNRTNDIFTLATIRHGHLWHATEICQSHA